jgi:hypothetical protein
MGDGDDGDDGGGCVVNGCHRDRKCPNNSRLWGDVYRSLTEHFYNNKGNWNSLQQLIEIVLW